MKERGADAYATVSTALVGVAGGSYVRVTSRESHRPVRLAGSVVLLAGKWGDRENPAGLSRGKVALRSHVGGFRVALGWLYGGFRVPIPWLSTGFVVALGGFGAHEKDRSNLLESKSLPAGIRSFRAVVVLTLCGAAWLSRNDAEEQHR
jgi:hypothetical protein